VLAQKRRGWSVAALQDGAADLQLSRAASGLVPNGAAGLVEVNSWHAYVALGLLERNYLRAMCSASLRMHTSSSPDDMRLVGLHSFSQMNAMSA
jgi:hypothetical protein